MTDSHDANMQDIRNFIFGTEAQAEMDIGKLWFDTFESYREKFESVRPDYDKLDKTTQIIGSLGKLELDMHNGGFIQFFCNWGYPAYMLALEGLDKIGAPTTKSLLIEAFSVINKYENDKRITNLWDIPSVLSNEDDARDDARLQELDEKYWQDEENIMKKMLNCFSEKK